MYELGPRLRPSSNKFSPLLMVALNASHPLVIGATRFHIRRTAPNMKPTQEAAQGRLAVRQQLASVNLDCESALPGVMFYRQDTAPVGEEMIQNCPVGLGYVVSIGILGWSGMTTDPLVRLTPDPLLCVKVCKALEPLDSDLKVCVVVNLSGSAFLAASGGCRSEKRQQQGVTYARRP